jgi:hypothetical protein
MAAGLGNPKLTATAASSHRITVGLTATENVRVLRSSYRYLLKLVSALLGY